MDRYNIYTFIHKGLRRALFKQLIELGQLDEANPVAMQQCLEAIQQLLMCFSRYHHHEKQFIQPLLPVFSITQQEHLQYEHKLHELNDLIERINSMPAVISASALHQLYLQLSLFCATQLQQMYTEETQMMEYLWRQHNDEQLHAIHNQLVQSQSDTEQYQTLRLILPALTETERLSVLLTLQKQMPESSFCTLVNEVQQELNASQLRTVHKYIKTIISTVCAS
ncbi:hypothetical protein [Rheinheimera soli]|uniref:Hemerythrin-like domain-containing protein n=1 Tax=Rheinheimera soli TaxID=443616 RepID=A0ABU1VZS0_9GAMM|nr:hypothetical protein [Rheinheimera soli]MDR7120908.1 hypothetical protein [Rheinheimera soli]